MAEYAHKQTVQVVIASGASSATATLTGFSDHDKMTVMRTARLEDGLSEIGAKDIEVDAWATSATEVKVERYGTPSYALTVTCVVIQWGDDTPVYSGTWSFGATDLTTSPSIGATVTLAETFGWENGRCDSPALGDDGRPRHRMRTFKLNTTTVTIERGSHGVTEATGHWYVVTSSTLTVEHVENLGLELSAASHTETIDSVTLGETWTLCTTNNTIFNGNEKVMFCVDLQNATTLRLRRGTTVTVTIDIQAQIISDSAFKVQRGEWATTSLTDTATLTAVVLADAFTKTGSGLPGGSSSSVTADGTLDQRYSERTIPTTTSVKRESNDVYDSTGTETWEVIELAAQATGEREFIVPPL